jgi:DNA-binding LacI/PurR family transcriptional regulator
MQGSRVPDDLAIATTEDSSWVEHIRPGLTAVHIPMHEVGTRATEMLLSLLEAPGGTPHHEILPVTLTVRASSDPSLAHA